MYENWYPHVRLVSKLPGQMMVGEQVLTRAYLHYTGCLKSTVGSRALQGVTSSLRKSILKDIARGNTFVVCLSFLG